MELSNNKSDYLSFLESSEGVPIFFQTWWLDAVADGYSWECVVVKSGNKILAAWPFLIKKYFFFTVLTQPKLTQFLGPIYFKKFDSNYQKYKFEYKIMESMEGFLPTHHYFHQSFSSFIKNWIPFYWLGYVQTTRYTYRINDISNLSVVWSGMQDNIKSDIKKALGRHKLTIRTDLDIEDFILLNNKVFSRLGIKKPYSDELIRKVNAASANMNSSKIFIATDPLGQMHAGVYIVWDSESAYYLLGGSDPDFRNSGAVSLCLWEAIKFASSVSKSFDFEGSMIKPVEKYIRAFGGIQTPFFYLEHIPSKLLSTYLSLKKILLNL